MRIAWSAEALSDLADLRTYIAEDDPEAAKRTALAIVRAIKGILPVHPAFGKPGRVPGTRELIVPRTSVIVPYRVRGAQIEILRIYHESRRWPDHF